MNERSSKMEQEKSQQIFSDVQNMADQGRFVRKSETEKNDRIDNTIDESRESVDKCTEKHYGRGQGENVHSDDTKDTSLDVTRSGNMDANSQNDLQGNQDDIEKNEDENESIVEALNAVQEALQMMQNDVHGLRNALCVKYKDEDGHERGLGSWITELLNGVRGILVKLAKPAATAEDLEGTQINIISEVAEAHNSFKKDLRNDIKSDFRSELSSRINNLRNEIIRIHGKLENGVSREMGSISDSIKKLQTGQQTLSDFVEEGFQTTLKQELKPLKALETASGQIAQLKDGIDAVSQVLTDRGLQLRQKFPASTPDEDVLCQLTEYGHTILTQLSVAARWYARSKEELDHLAAIKKQAEKEHSRGYEAGKSIGQSEGRRALVRNLFKRFGDGETLLLDRKEGFEPLGQLNILAGFLQNEGLHRGYAPGDTVEVTEENYKELSVRIKNLPYPHAKVCIVKGDYYLEEECLQKAECKQLLPDSTRSETVTDEVPSEAPTDN